MIYGPHCHHDDCGWLGCDRSDRLIEFPCAEQSSCPHCGPGSPQWPQVAADLRDWLSTHFGTTDPERLRSLRDITDAQRRTALGYAELLRSHT